MTILWPIILVVGLITAFFAARWLARLRSTVGALSQKAGEAAARELRLREFIDICPVAFFAYNSRSEILLTNRKFTELFGYQPAEIRTLDDWWQRACPDPAVRAGIQLTVNARAAEAAATGGEIRPFEAEVTCKDGTRRLIEFRRQTLGDRTLVVANDLSERQRTALALRESETRKSAMLESALDCVVTMDHHGAIVEFNPAAERVFGYTRSTVLGRELAELIIPPALRERHRRGMAHYLATGHGPVLGRRIEIDAQRADGTTFPVELAIAAFKVGDTPMFTAYLRDITERKRTEDTLRASEERYRLLVENSTELVAQIDAHGIYHYASPNHIQLSGYAAQELVGTSVFRNIHPEDLPLVRRAMNDEQAVHQFRYRFKDGSWHWLESTARRFLTSAGEPMGAVLSRDITTRVHAEETRKRLEDQLRQAHKMEAIGTLAGGIAHDFNNILTGILGNTQLAERELGPGHPVRPLLAAAVKASLRARDLVAKILTFSRHRDQPHAVHPIGPVVHEALGLLRASLPSTIQFRTELTLDHLPVLCDPVQIHQVVMNLGTNAAYAMQPRGGVLTIGLDTLAPDEAIRASHPALPAGPFARLFVRDTGAGIDAATRERIFEPFFTTKPVGEGTGLGLSVVHGIVEAHQGAIIVDSTPGTGTTFTLWFPTVEPGPAKSSSLSPILLRGQGERVLYVDDEPSVSEIGARMFVGLGYRVTAFVSSAAALAEFRRDPAAFDLVVSDLTMPELSGADLVSAIRTLAPAVPVLITTGYMRGADIERARAHGVRHFLQKPFSLESLATSLRQTLLER